MRTLNDSIKPLLALRPIQLSGEGLPVRGPVIDRKGYEAAVVECLAGDQSGTPTRFGVVFKVQECATSTGTFTDVTSASVTLSGTAAAMLGNSDHIDLNLIACERYIQLVATPSFFGGSSPKVHVGACCILGEAKAVPAA